MSQLFQYCTRASLYNGPFGDGSPWPAAGMGYVFVTEDRHLIVVDGGHGADAGAFLELLCEIAGGAPAVDLWIVTHPHGDHYGAIREIAAREELRKTVTVKELWWYFPPEFRDWNGKAPCEAANRHLREICASLGAVEHTPRIGETVTVGGLRLDMLFVPVDCSEIHNPNSLSLIFTVKSPDKTVLITGDAFADTLGYCAERYGEALKSDILQLPHHGLCDTGLPDFYRLVGAETLLIPISEAGDRCMRSGIYGDATAANLVAEKMAAKIHRAYEGTVAVEL
jgi:glyoxylase-like metal-dependent hydrolase (beta-lactamase superfamily II)